MRARTHPEPSQDRAQGQVLRCDSTDDFRQPSGQIARAGSWQGSESTRKPGAGICCEQRREFEQDMCLLHWCFAVGLPSCSDSERGFKSSSIYTGHMGGSFFNFNFMAGQLSDVFTITLIRSWPISDLSTLSSHFQANKC